MHTSTRPARCLVCIPDPNIRGVVVTQLRTLVPAITLDVVQDSTAALALFTERVEYWPDLVMLAAMIGPIPITEMVMHLRRGGLKNTPIIVLGRHRGRRELAAKAAGATVIIAPEDSAEVVAHLSARQHAERAAQRPPETGYEVESVEWDDLEHGAPAPSRSPPQPVQTDPDPVPALLVVAEDRNQRMALARLCETAGARVSKAATARDAQPICRQSAIDLIVVAGAAEATSLVQALRCGNERPTPIYLVLTANKPELRALAADCGATEVLSMPEAPHALRAFVDTARQPRSDALPTLTGPVETSPRERASKDDRASDSGPATTDGHGQVRDIVLQVLREHDTRKGQEIPNALALNQQFREHLTAHVELRVTTLERAHDELRRTHRCIIEQQLAQLLPAMANNFFEDVRRRQRRMVIIVWVLLVLWVITLVLGVMGVGVGLG